MRSRQEALTPVDDRALSLAVSLFAHAHQGALAFLSPSNGWPQVSRVAVGRDAEGIPLILISGLSAHFAALSHDPRCCLLLGESGGGDPLAHPRISVDCRAVRIPDVDKPIHRDAFVAWQPKAALYVDFADFAFWRLIPESASLNGGFGKAHALDASALPGILRTALALASAPPQS